MPSRIWRWRRRRAANASSRVRRRLGAAGAGTVTQLFEAAARRRRTRRGRRARRDAHVRRAERAREPARSSPPGAGGGAQHRRRSMHGALRKLDRGAPRRAQGRRRLCPAQLRAPRGTARAPTRGDPSARPADRNERGGQASRLRRHRADVDGEPADARAGSEARPAAGERAGRPRVRDVHLRLDRDAEGRRRHASQPRHLRDRRFSTVSNSRMRPAWPSPPCPR